MKCSRRDTANGALRVCHLGKFYPPAPGGMESHVRTLARAQAELGAEVRVLCVNHRNRRGDDVTWESFAGTETVEEWDGPVRLTRIGRRASLARFDLCPSLPAMLGRLQRSVDLLHLHVPNPTMLLTLAAARPLWHGLQTMPQRATVPHLVVTYHSDVVRQRRLGMMLRPFEHLVLNRAEVIVSNSPGYPDGSPLLQAHSTKVRVLPMGIDLNPYLHPSNPALDYAVRLRREHGAPLWIAVGRLVYYKGLDNAIRALAAVPGRLMIIGEGPLEADLRRLADEVAVAGRVLWYGRLTDEQLVGAYHAATALWFPSNARSEAFGLVQVEAMASGCPVINAAIPASGVCWVSRHEETGLTVPLNDPAALAHAANRLLTEPGLRERLAAGGRARAVQEFAHGLMARRCLEMYREVRCGMASGPSSRGTASKPRHNSPAAPRRFVEA
jgi:rhamnosyl/mannosyltransferase